MPLMPKRVKHRKVSKGSRKGFATNGDKLAYGDYGIKALGRGWVSNEDSPFQFQGSVHP